LKVTDCSQANVKAELDSADLKPEAEAEEEV
jgi:hypothetical protein